MLFVLFLLWHLGVAASQIDISIQTQIATLLTSDQVVDNKSDSLYMGIVYLTALPSQTTPGLYTFRTTIWHTNPFATRITINGNRSSLRGFEGTVIYDLSSNVLPTDSRPESCPIYAMFDVTESIYNLLLQGFLYVQISSFNNGAPVSTGQLRGQLEERNDLVVAFISSNINIYGNPSSIQDADVGMVLMLMYELGNDPTDPSSAVGIHVRSITKLAQGTIVYLALRSLDITQNYTIVKLIGRVSRLGISSVKANTVVRRGEVMANLGLIGAGPAFGSGSSPLLLVCVDDAGFNTTNVATFTRTPWNNDALISLRRGIPIAGSGLPT